MAITPFTQPVKQGKFIPQQPRLPVEQIGQAAQNIYKQDVKQRDRLRQIMDKVAQQKAASADEPVLRQLEERYRNRFNQLAEDDLLFGDEQQISDMAREFAGQAQLLEQNRKNIQEQVKQINDLEGVSESDKRQLRSFVLSGAGLDTTDQGLIDEDSVFQPTSVGDEANLAEVARDAISGLEERVLRNKEGQRIEGVSVRPDMGIVEFYKKRGVGPDRMAKAIESEYRDNPKVQNWMRQEQMRYLARNPSESEDDARDYVNKQLSLRAREIANNRYYTEDDTSRRSLPESATTQRGDVAVRYGSPKMPEQMDKGSPEYKEFQDRKQRIQNNLVKNNFSEEERRRIEKIRRRTKGRYDPSEVSGQRAKSQLLTFGSERFRKEMRDAGLWERYQQTQRMARQNAISTAYAPKFLSPGEQNEHDYQQFMREIRNINVNQIDSEVVDEIAEQQVNNWMPFIESAGKETKKRWLRRAMRNASDARISDDGTTLQVTVGTDLPSKYNALEGRNINISTRGLTRNQIDRFTQFFPDDTRETIMRNWRYQDTPITSEPRSVEDNSRVRRGSDNMIAVETKTDGSWSDIRYRDTISNLGANEVVDILLPVARREQFTNLDSREEFKRAFEEYQSNEDTNRVQDLKELLNSPARFRHKGNAIQIAKQLGN